MNDEDIIWLNGHALRCDLISTFTIDDPAADYDHTIVEDRADLYAVVCRTCRHVADLTLEQRMLDVTHLCRNKRTGEWLPVDRTNIDDTHQDGLTRVLHHCRPGIVPLPVRTPQRHESRHEPQHEDLRFTYGTLADIDDHALAAVRTLMGLGVSPWEAVAAYAASVT